MAEIKNIDICDGKIDIKLSINKEEYGLLKHQMADLIILPCGKDSLVHSLTTGKLGNRLPVLRRQIRPRICTKECQQA